MKKILSVSAAVVITLFTSIISVSASAVDDFWDNYNGIPGGGTYAGSTSISDELFSINILNELLDIFKDATIYDILDELAGMIDVGQFVIPFCLAMLTCLMGYKLYRIYAGFCGFVLGGAIGLLLAIKCESMILLIIGLLIAIAFAYVAYQFYQIGLFILGSIISFPVFAIISLLVSQTKAALIVAVLLACAVGVVVAIFTKPIVIISTSISGGNSAGVILACVITHTRLMGLFGILFTCLGLYYQSKVNNGLLESGSLIEKMKNKGLVPESVLPHSKPVSLPSTAEKCHKCGAVLTPGIDFCMECGEKVVKSVSAKETIVCPVCKSVNSPESDFCMNCGSKMGMSSGRKSSSESETAELENPYETPSRPSSAPAASPLWSSSAPAASPSRPSSAPAASPLWSSSASAANPLKISPKPEAATESGKIKSSFKDHSDTKNSGLKKSSSFKSASVSFDSDKTSDKF